MKSKQRIFVTRDNGHPACRPGLTLMLPWGTLVYQRVGLERTRTLFWVSAT